MSAPRPRRLILTLPPLTPAQADAVLELLGAVQDAFFAACQDELLEAATEASAAAQDAREQDERDDQLFWEHLLTPP
jgi:hypothetical protein